jgi:hypothetical protein
MLPRTFRASATVESSRSGVEELEEPRLDRRERHGLGRLNRGSGRQQH